MDQGQLNWIANFIWGIADDVLRDVYVRGKYRDVILPMVILRRLDAVLEPTKQAVLQQKARLDKTKITNQDGALRSVSRLALGKTSSHSPSFDGMDLASVRTPENKSPISRQDSN